MSKPDLKPVEPEEWTVPEGAARERYFEMMRGLASMSERSTALVQEHAQLQADMQRLTARAEERALVMAETVDAPLDRPLIFDGMRFAPNDQPGAEGITIGIDRSLLESDKETIE